VGRALAARGFLVAVPDYRLVPEVRFPVFLQDNAAAVRWLITNSSRYGGDSDRIVLMGHSAGAYSAAMLSLDPRWLGSARRAIRGFVGLAGPYDFLPLDGPVTKAAFGQEPRLGTTQPINFASADDPPALLLHGAKDTTVFARNSQRLQARLAQAGVDARIRIYPSVGHVGIVTALARPFRRQAPALDDAVMFATQVTAQGAR
jgi:acetyl esterase/lipase